MVRKDTRRVNATSIFKNPQGRWFVFGQVGRGKNGFIKTLGEGSTALAAVKNAREKGFEGYINTGEMKGIPTYLYQGSGNI